MRWWKKIIVVLTFPISVPLLCLRSRQSKEESPMMFEAAPDNRNTSGSDRLNLQLPVSSATQHVGATIPVINDIKKWSKFRALVYTDDTKDQITNTYLSQPTTRYLNEGEGVTIIPSSFQAEFNPKNRSGIPWLDGLISETFYIRLLPGHTQADIQLDFMTEDIAIPFGTVTMTIHIKDNTNISSASTSCTPHIIYFLHSPKDSAFVGMLVDSLEQVGCKITNDISRATRVQFIYTTQSCRQPELIEVAKRYTEKLAITYYETSVLAKLSNSPFSNVPHKYYNNKVDVMMDDIRYIKHNQDFMISMLQECLNMLEANYNAICDRSTVTVPHLFHIWPDKPAKGLSSLNPKNWAMHRYRLHLLCEGIHVETGKQQDHQHYVFNNHQGYRIDIAKKWFSHWAPIILKITKMTSLACKIALCVTGAGPLANLIPDNIALDTLNKALPILDIVSEDLTNKDVRNLIAERAQHYMYDFDEAVSNVESGLVTDGATEKSFLALAEFLEDRDPEPKNAGLVKCYYPLHSSHHKAGKVVWLCPDHARDLSRV